MRCEICNKKSSFPYQCKWCSLHTCISCLCPEIHNCVHMNEMKAYYSQLLKSKLESGKMKNNHNLT